MSFWVFDNNMLVVFVLTALLTIVFLLSNTLRRKVGFIRKSLLPTAVIGGIIMLILRSLGLFDWLSHFFNQYLSSIPKDVVNVSNDGNDAYYYDQIQIFFEAITYHALAIGFIALSLKITKKENNPKRQSEIMDTGLVTVNSYAIQGIIGIIITIVLATTFMNNLLPAAGLLLPMGFGQGSGQALSFGKMFENDYNFIGGTHFGLTIAAVGFLVACLVGVVHIFNGRKKGFIKAKDENFESISSEEVISSPNDVPLTESVDRLSIQIFLILFVYVITFLFMFGVQQIAIEGFFSKTVKPLIWGFNFLLGSLFAILIKQTFKGLQKANLMTRDYPNNYLLNRISGFVFDLMIIAGIAAIKIQVLESLILPLFLICLVGTIVSYYYIRYVCKRIFPDYPQEAFLSLFGMLTGTASTGMILLREVDPKFETPAANNLVFQSFYAIAFGFPLLLLLGVAPQSLSKALFSLGILIAMFVFFNIILFRRKIFKKHNQLNK